MNVDMNTRPLAKVTSVSDRIAPLQTVFLHLTKACNLQCAYCYFSARKPLPDELRLDEFALVWRDIVDISPEKVVFTGGEPLLRRDILDVLKGLSDADREHRITRSLNTNGHLVTADLAAALVGLVDEIRVSLDALEERNDKLRGRGNFSAAVRALDTLYEAGFEPRVLVTVTSVSLPDLEELILFLQSHHICRVTLNGLRPMGRGEGHWEWRPNLLEAKHAMARALGKEGLLVDYAPDSLLSLNDSHHCGVGRFINILPNGDVFPCHVLVSPEFRCGNLREERLSDICRRNGLLGRLAALDFAELVNEDPSLRDLLDPTTCMGNVYARTRDSRVWGERLFLIANKIRK